MSDVVIITGANAAGDAWGTQSGAAGRYSEEDVELEEDLGPEDGEFDESQVSRVYEQGRVQGTVLGVPQVSTVSLGRARGAGLNCEDSEGGPVWDT